MKSFLGTVKIIYLIREPLARALSNLKMKVERRNLQRPSDADWRRLANECDIRERGDYRAYVPRWKTQFEGSDILFLPFGRIAPIPRPAADVEDFLSLSRHSYPTPRRGSIPARRSPSPRISSGFWRAPPRISRRSSRRSSAKIS